MSQRFFVFSIGLLLSAASPLRALEPAEPLHASIDRLIEASFVGRPAPVAGDAEFLRRVYLDLTGMIPSSDEAKAFLDDPDPEKRARLIDRLLASPEFTRHQATLLDVMFMERRPQKVVGIEEWQKYLFQSVAANKPFDQVSREILGADGTDEKGRGAARFYLDRDGEMNLLTRDVGRIFFGRDLQCAQCHDHPLISDYHQTEYYGLAAFFLRTSLFTNPQDKQIYLAEKADGETAYQSVFDANSKGSVLPTLPGGVALADPAFPAGEEYIVAPADNVRSIPKYSRRQKLAEVAAASNRAFNRNIANRLWAQMFGRGLVQPVDLHHGDNPSGQPELTELLGDSFAAMKYDLRAFLRQLALSRAYQRAFEMPGDVSQQAAEFAARLPEIQAAQAQLQPALDAAIAAAAQAKQQLTAAEQAAAPVEMEMSQARTQESEAKKAETAAAAALTAAQQKLEQQNLAKAAVVTASNAAQIAATFVKDAQVQDAAAQLKAKAETLLAEIAVLEASIPTLQTTVQDATAKLAAARQAVAAVEPKLAPPRQAIEAARQTLAAAEEQAQKAQVALAAVKQRAIDVEKLNAFAQTRAAAETAHVALETSQKATADQAAAVAQKTQTLAQQQAEMPTIEKAQADAAAALAQIQTDYAAKAEIGKSVAELAALAEAVRQKAPADTALTGAAQMLAERSQQLQTELAESQKGVAAQEQASQAATAALTAARTALEQTQAALTAGQARQTELAAATVACQAAADSAAGALDSGQQQLADAWTRRAAVGAVRQLSPEQMAWSMMRAAGLVDQQRRAAEAEANKTIPPEVAAADPAKATERAAAIELAVFNALKGNVAQFVTLFAPTAGQPQDQFFATADQALFFDNGGFLNGWLNPGGGNLAERLVNAADPKQLAEEMYLSVLTRRPSPEETADVEAWLAPRTADRPAAIKELAWALLTSSEFRFNH